MKNQLKWEYNTICIETKNTDTKIDPQSSKIS